MNRAEKRHQKKLARKAVKIRRGHPPPPPGQALSGASAILVSELAQKGVQLHQAGRVQEAETIYLQILDINPAHADANHLLGVLLSQVGNPAQAVELISRAIATAPDRPVYHSNLGSALQKLGRLDDAVTSYHKAVAIKPGYAEAHNDLGIVLMALGRLDDAVASFHKAVAIKPDYAEAHNNLGSALQKLGRLDDAVASYHKAIAIKPDNAEPHNNLGIALMALERLDDAVASFHKAVAIKPDYAEAHNNLGSALQKLEQFDHAVASYHKAIAIKPDYAAPHNNLGNTLQALGRLDDAVASFHKAIAIKPDYASAHSNLGNALQALGRLDDAVASYHKAVAIKPDYAAAHKNLAEVLEHTNRTEALREAVKVAKQNCPGHPHLALGEARLLKRDGDYAAAREVLEATGEGVPDADFLNMRAHLLGELNDRLGDTETAFDYFREGNRQRGDTPAARLVDGSVYLAQIDILEKRFTPDWVAGWRNLKSSDGPCGLVFLVGFPRSGTTLLDTMLRSHAAITVVEEIPTVKLMREALMRLPGGYPDGLAELVPTDLEELRQVYFAELDNHLGSEGRTAVIVDKLPLNLVEAGLIHRIFPQARFLFVQRHPCDSVLSCFMQNFNVNQAMAHFLDLEDAARLYDKVMTLWQTYLVVLPLEVHTVCYESLIEAFEETLTPLLDFLGVEWDDSIRNYTETASRRERIYTPSYNQVTQPLYTRARGRWERYSKNMQPVLPTLLPWARRFGYPESPHPPGA